MPARQDLYDVYVTVDGIDCGRFDAWTGGDGDSEETTYNEGGGNRVALGGQQTRDNVVCGRLFKYDRDLALYRLLDPRRGKARMTATKFVLDDDRNPISPPVAIRYGKLKRVSNPEANSNESGESMWEVEMTPEN